VRNLFRGEDAEDTAGTQVARAEQDKPSGNLANSFQHSLGEGSRREEKAFSKAQVPHLTLFPLFSSPACCSLSVLPRFLPVFLASASQVSAVSISAYTPAAFILLLSFKRSTRRDAPGKKFAVVLFGA